MLALTPRPLVRDVRVVPLVRAIALGVAAYAAVAPVLALAHELVVLTVANLLDNLASLAAGSSLLRALPLDPIYTGALLHTVGGIEPRGLALAGPLGAWAHEHWSGLFAPASLVAPHAWASAIVAPGSTILSRWLCGLTADGLTVGLGLAAIHASRHGRSWLAVFGAIVQAQVVVTHLIELPPDLADVEAAGVPFAVAMLVSGDVQAGPRLAYTLDAMVDPVRDAVLGLGMVALAYLPAILVLAGWRGWGLARRLALPRSNDATRHSCRSSSGWSLVARFAASPVGHVAGICRFLGRMTALAALSVAVVWSPVGSFADSQTRFLSASRPAEADAVDAPRDAPNGGAAPGAAQATARPDPSSQDRAESQSASRAVANAASSSSVLSARTDLTAPVTASAPVRTPVEPVSDGPSVVAVSGGKYEYVYTVNGSPLVIRGMGYNVQYRGLPVQERIRLLDRDFKILRDLGVNTVFGWEPAEFDDVLLDAAERHGLGVAPPYDLDPETDYADPAVRARLTGDVLAWVARYRHHPAVRMWAIGNEVLHKLVYPSWMPIRSDPAWEQRARAFAAFYVELVDKVHAADPDHPIVHRDAEDAYLTWVRDAMQPGGHRPWFVYGVNAYTPRLAEILARWPSQGWDTPLLVSEMAPGGMSPADRPEGLRSMWQMVRGSESWVLGGSVYAWTTNGPEEVDRVFGLVDGNGQAVDGALAMVGAMFRGTASEATSVPVRPGTNRDERIWSYAVQAIREIQAGRSARLLLPAADGSIMGDVGAVAQEPILDSEMVVQRVRDPRRVSWARDGGVDAEWWVTWLPPSTPNRKLTFVVQDRQGGSLGVTYIYHGPR